MAKIILGSRPKTFKRDIKFKMLDGSIGDIQIEFFYRTRKEFAALGDELQAAAQTEAEAEIAAIEQAQAEGKPLPKLLTNLEQTARQTGYKVDYLMTIVKGWNLDIPFTREAVEQLADEVPMAITVAVSTYAEAIAEGRLGN